MADKKRLMLFDFPESIEVELAGYLTACDITSFLVSCKKASQYNRPVIWRELLSVKSDSNCSSRAKKHKKKGMTKKVFCKNFFRDTFINIWKAIICDRRKDFTKALLSSYDSDMKLSIHRECIRTAESAIKSSGLIANQKQRVCKHNHVLLTHSKTIYPELGYCGDSRELILNTFCSNCSSLCYEKMVFCACCNDASNFASNSCCLMCLDAKKFAGHHNHPKIEFRCPRDYYLEKEYTVGCFDCGLAFVARIASNYKLRRQQPTQIREISKVSNIPLVTAEFICPSRQNVFRNMLLNYEGKAELLFRMKAGDMLFNHGDDDLLL